MHVSSDPTEAVGRSGPLLYSAPHPWGEHERQSRMRRLEPPGSSDQVTETAKIISTEKVREEVGEKGLEKRKPDALYVNELIQGGKIGTKAVDKRLFVKIKKNFKLGDGEASVIALQIINEYDAIITDDNAARKSGIILGSY